MKYKVLKEFLTVKNPRWLAPGEIIDGQPSGARIKALLEKGYIEEIPEQPKTVDDLEEGDECWEIINTTYGQIAKREFWNPALEPKRSCGLVTLTREEAEKEIAHSKARVILKRDTKGFKPDWKSHEQSKYFVDWDNIRNEFCFEDCTFIQTEQIPFASKADAVESTKKHPQEWKTYLGVEE